MLLWASCYPLITVGLDSAPHLTFAVLRAVLAGTTLLAVGIILRKPFPRDGSIWGWIILAGLGMTGLGYYGMFHAAEFVSPGLATVIANSQRWNGSRSGSFFGIAKSRPRKCSSTPRSSVPNINTETSNP